MQTMSTFTILRLRIQHQQISSYVAKSFLAAVRGATITERAVIESIASNITKLGAEIQNEKQKICINCNLQYTKKKKEEKKSTILTTQRVTVSCKYVSHTQPNYFPQQ